MYLLCELDQQGKVIKIWDRYEETEEGRKQARKDKADILYNKPNLRLFVTVDSL